MSKVVPLRIPEHLDELAGISASQEHTDKATALRQWLYHGATLYVLRLVSEGSISIGHAAELLETSIHELHRLAEIHSVELGASEEQTRSSLSTADRLAESLQSDRRGGR